MPCRNQFKQGKRTCQACTIQKAFFSALQYAQNSQGVLSWGITLLAIGVAQPTNGTITPCQNQFGK